MQHIKFVRITFGLETWTLKDKDMASSETQEIKFFGKRVGVSRKDNLHNEENHIQVVMSPVRAL
jgi:hypothetical protein